MNRIGLPGIGQAGVGGEFVQKPPNDGVGDDFLTGADPAGEQVREPDQLAAIAADIALSHSVVLDRMTGTAILSRDQARDIGTRRPPRPARLPDVEQWHIQRRDRAGFFGSSGAAAHSSSTSARTAHSWLIFTCTPRTRGLVAGGED
ncbi:hypothetical protein ACIBL3_40545 [Kribbella sp. NPDC050124]|uniref:hypothetical protein n=1 Tax=Kribbella sp. NPDC050124 TaxID=3364114 RepID=UPI0037BD71A0